MAPRGAARQLEVEGNVRPWLIGKGLLSTRVKSRAANGTRGGWSNSGAAGCRPRRSWSSGAGRRRLFPRRRNGPRRAGVGVRSNRDAGFHVVPASWLAELGDTPLDEMLDGLSGIDRSVHEYAWLPADDPLSQRALRTPASRPRGVARRSRIALRGAPLLLQELFLPTVGLV